MSPSASRFPLHVVLIGYNRPHSLQRLVSSLRNAEYGPDDVSVSVSFALDHAANSSIDHALDLVVASLANTWQYGQVSVRRRRSRAGLRDNILGAYVPASDDAPPAVFLEDDIELSPLWWHWIQACLRRYASPPSKALVGISLFTPDDMKYARAPLLM